MRLTLTMETMHAAGRRTLPPVPRPNAERAAAATEDSPTERFVVDLPTSEQLAVVTDEVPEDVDQHPVDEVLEDQVPDDDAAAHADADEEADVEADVPVVDGDVRDEPSAIATPAPDQGELDPAQEFVTLLRTAAVDFAEAAGAASAVVREAVPPARHRRARCRLVLRYADASDVDVTFLGPAGRPGTPSRHGFDRQIRRWLAAGQHREDAWLVTDPEAEDGLAVDLSAWMAAA